MMTGQQKMKFATVFLAILLIGSLSGCGKNRSEATGWEYNNPDNGGFEKIDYAGQETGPGLVFIEGGTFVMGNIEEDVMHEFHNVKRRVTVSSFYMDKTEVSNIHYREYLYWLDRVHGEQYPEVKRKAMPDEKVWRDELAYNEPYVEYYFTHPAYNDYPVVGVTWEQANEYAKWRSDRVNEGLLVDRGILNDNPNQKGADNFNTDAYLEGQYEGDVRKNLPDLDPNGTGERPVRFEDGILQPDYRLPTEAEWEYAALAVVGNHTHPDEEAYVERKIYPWSGTSARYPKNGRWQGDFLANFKRGRGDNMGLAGNLNDNASITAPVNAYVPNDFGLYNMAGNVAEWVLDVYRPMNSLDVEDFNPYRGNVYTKKALDENGDILEKDSLGHIQYINETDEEVANRFNYRRADVRDFGDGDEASRSFYDPKSSLIDNESRVYKGGSWKDRAYFLAPATRRFMDQTKSTDYIGFRCAMSRVGSATGSEFQGGNSLGKKRK